MCIRDRDWRVGLMACATWLLVALIARISSLSALIAAAMAPIYAMVLGKPMLMLAALFMAVLIFIRHKANIARLMDGSEPRIGGKKSG